MRYLAFVLMMSIMAPGAFAQPPGQDYLVVPHVPQNTDIFSVSIVVENLLDQKRFLGFYPFGENGASFDVVTVEVDPKARVVFTMEQLFKSNPVSFFYVTGHRMGELLSQDTVTGLVVGVSLGYAGSPESATFTEAIQDPSKRWRVHTGDWKDTFDGIAVVNMDVCAANTFELRHYAGDGKFLASQTVGSPRGSFYKQVVNLSSHFDPVAGSYVDIIAPMNLAVTALRGSLDMEAWIVGNMAIALPDYQEEQRILEENRQKFHNLGINHYSINMQQSCFCAGNVTREVGLRVMDNWIESFNYNDDASEVAVEERQNYKTVDQLFTMVEELLAANYFRVEVTYDPTYGHPTQIRIDQGACIVDEELTILIKGFQPLR